MSSSKQKEVLFLTDFVTALTGTNGITAADIWSAITPTAVLLVILIPIKVGYNMLSGTVNNFTRPKSKKVMKQHCLFLFMKGGNLCLKVQKLL